MIGVILAGGTARRMGGGDKGALLIGGRSILSRLAATLAPQCEALVLNANGDATRFAPWHGPVVADAVADQPGPLAGVLAGLDHAAAHHPHAGFVVTVPTDTPFVPLDLVARLQDARIADQGMIVCARSGGREHHVVALWAVALRDDLRRYLENGGRKVADFTARHPRATAEWPVTPYDPFFNVNAPDDLHTAARIVTRTV